MSKEPNPSDVAEAVVQIKDHAIFTMDLEGKATTWNIGVRNVLGFERDEFIGADLIPLIWTSEDVAKGAAQKELEDAARNGLSSDDRWMLRKDKVRFWAMGTTTAVFKKDRTLTGYSKVIRDLTFFKLTQDDLLARTHELAQANADLQDLIDLVAHDFREPLRGILFHLQVLEEEGPTSPLIQKERSAIRAQIDRLQLLITSMLEVSRTGQVEVKRQRVPLGTVASEASKQVEGLREERQGVVRIHPPMPDVDGDPVLLSQALANLISNGLKYNESHPPKVDVTAAEEGGRVVVRVSDNGIGIAQNQLETVFRMFKRLHRKDAYGGGAGVGLPLVRKVVERHDGRIRAESQEGKGTTFTISLPRAGAYSGGA